MATFQTVESVMTRNVVVLHEEDNLEWIEEAMSRHHFRHLPVVDGTRVVGILSQRDILRVSVGALANLRHGELEQRTLEERCFVANMMNRDVLTTRPEATVIEAARAMLTGRVGALPVVDGDGALVGIVSRGDVLLALVRHAEGATETLDALAVSLPKPPEAAGG